MRLACHLRQQSASSERGPVFVSPEGPGPSSHISAGQHPCRLRSVTAEILASLGALGGLAVFVGSVAALARGIFRQVAATEANTEAVNRLARKLDDHETRIARLEGSR